MNKSPLHITKLNSKENNPSNQATGFNDRVHTGQRFQQAEATDWANIGARITRPISYQAPTDCIRIGLGPNPNLPDFCRFSWMRVAKKRKKGNEN